LVFALYLTTHFAISSSTFATIILSAAGLQAAAGSYLQTSVIADASIFGPAAMQSLMSGQAAVGVALSAVQLITAYGSVHLPTVNSDFKNPSTSILPPTPPPIKDDSPAKSARAFFALSTVFLLVTIVAHAYLVRLPAYTAVAGSVDQSGTRSRSPSLHGRSDGSEAQKAHKTQILRVAKANWVYELAVAFVFIVTLVRSNV
jgi:equilibrative nucleoside transporter 1/2/3